MSEGNGLPVEERVKEGEIITCTGLSGDEYVCRQSLMEKGSDSYFVVGGETTGTREETL